MFKATDEDEQRLRQMFDVIKDDGDVSKSVQHILRIAASAVDLVETHKAKVYP